MSKFSKKVISVALTATTSVWMSGAMLLIPTAHAQTTADLQAQIAALLAQIQALQAQLTAQQGGTVSCPAFTRDLTVGSTGSDVKCLQQFLNTHGAQVAASGVGSSGNETTYFGNLTRNAVASWQAANGISPTAGYFGPITRARVNSMLAVGPPGPIVTPPPAGGLGVSLASDSPTGSAIAGAGQVEVGKFNFTTAAGTAATLTGLTFRKVGVVSDSNINNLYLADESGSVIAQYTSLSGGVATFSGLNIAVSGNKKLTLRLDLSSSATAGNTIAWSLETVTTSGSVSVSGTPVTSHTLTATTVSNPSLATVTWNFNDVGSSVDAGTTNVLTGSASVTVSNSAVWLKNIKYTLVGSANWGDLRNLKLQVNGTQVGSTVGAPNSDGSVVFDVGTSPVKLNSGNSTVDLYADVMGSPNRDVTVRILRPYDLHFVDSQYNTGVSPTVTDDSNKITINKGQITVSLASDTPTGNIPNGASNVTLTKINIYAAGEPVKVKFLDITITQSASGSNWSTSTAEITDDIENIQLVDDAGGQVGSTISTVTSGTGSGQCTLTSATVLTCHFGTSGSPINYIVPANTTRVVSLKTNVLSTNDATSLKGALVAMTNNLEGQISFQQASSGAVSGAVLTVVSTPLSVARGSFANPTYVGGANNVKIASFSISASSAEGARVNSLTLDKDSNANFDIQNLKVMVGSTQFGTTRATVGDAETSLTFSGSSPITVASGGSVTVDVFADILSSATAATHTSTVDLTGWTAVGTVSNSSISFPGAVDGQDIVISSGPTLTIALDSANPASKYVVMSSADNSILSVRLTADNVEDIKITEFQVLDTITNNTAGRTSFKQLKVYDGSTALAGPKDPTIGNLTTSTVTFSFATPVIVLKSGSKTLTIKGDLETFSGGAVSNSGHVFSITSTSTVQAFGKDSNTTATVSGSASGNSQIVYRTKPTFTSSLVGASSARARVAVDDLATMNWTANSAFQVLLGTIAIKFTGQAVSANSTPFTVDLLKDDNTAFGSATQQTCSPGAGNSCTVTFGPQFTVSAGATQATKVRVSSASFFNGAQTGDALSVLINGVADVLWNDGTTAGIGLETSTVPFTIVNVSYE